MKSIKNRSSRRLLWRSFAVASLLWLGLGQGGMPEPAATGDGASAAAPRKKTASYVFDRPSLSLSDSDAQHLDQMNYSFALIKNGVASGSHWNSIKAFQAYIAKHPHITPVLSVGGWGADGFSQAAASADGRTRLVESILNLVQKHGFLGVDIDWEYPGSSAAGIASSSNDRQNFTLLLSELRKGLDGLTNQDGKPRLLGIALGADPSLIKNIDCAAVGGIVDQVNLMTYDLHSPKVASHHTPLYSSNARYPLSVDNAVKAFTSAGIPKSKIMIGNAFYGRIFQLKTASDSPVFTTATDSGSKTATYQKIKSNSAWKHGFDDQAKAAYATNGRQFLTYDNPDSIQHKAEYVKQNDLMGMMCWEYGGDANGELLSAMRRGLT